MSMTKQWPDVLGYDGFWEPVADETRFEIEHDRATLTADDEVDRLNRAGIKVNPSELADECVAVITVDEVIQLAALDPELGYDKPTAREEIFRKILGALPPLDSNETIGSDASGLDPEFNEPTPIEGEA